MFGTHSQNPPTSYRAKVPGREVIVVWVIRSFAFLACISLVIEFGFHTPPLPLGLLMAVQVLAVGVYVIRRAHQLFIASNVLTFLKRAWLDCGLAGFAVVFLLFEMEAAGGVRQAATFYVVLIQVLLIIKLAVEVVRFNMFVAQSNLHPARLFILTFVALIIIGTLILALPRSIEPHVYQNKSFSIADHLIDCAFTAVSATCVTGLVVYDTGNDFSYVGQVTILVLIQLGGLGLMVFGSVFGLLLSRKLSLRYSLAVQDALSHETLGTLKHMLVFIFVFTCAAETIGTVLIYPMFAAKMESDSALFHAIFHSISAFCNAGFALQRDSLVSYSGAWQVYVCLMPLIVLGGLGFPVLAELWRICRDNAWQLWDRRRRKIRNGSAYRVRLTLHTKIVLAVTTLLLAFPPLLFFLFESTATPVFSYRSTISGGNDEGRFMCEAGIGQRALDAVFLAATCRTAGFNTVNMDEAALSAPSHFLACMLMMIGGSPASTAGGIKTVTFSVLMLGVYATVRGRTAIEVQGRTIADHLLKRSATIAVMMIALVSAGTLALMFTDGLTLRSALFEQVSACGTVGLSTGVASKLSLVGRLILMGSMFSGRLGPLTLLIALSGKSRSLDYSYPEEPVSIG